MPSEGDAADADTDERPLVGQAELELVSEVAGHAVTLLALRRCRRQADADERVTGATVRRQLEDWFKERHTDRSVYNSLERLQEKNLVKVARPNDGRGNDYRISERGREVVRTFHLDEVERRIDPDAASDPDTNT